MTNETPTIRQDTASPGPLSQEEHDERIGMGLLPIIIQKVGMTANDRTAMVVELLREEALDVHTMNTNPLGEATWTVIATVYDNKWNRRIARDFEATVIEARRLNS